MICFLTDENIFPKIVEFLRSYNFDIKDIREEPMKGLSDEEIISLAKNERRVLITFDKHFTNILQYPPELYFGIIRIRIHPPILNLVIKSLERFLNEFDLSKIKGKLIILESDGYRIYPYRGL